MCEQSKGTKFENEQKLLQLQITQTRHTLRILWKKCLSSRPSNMKKNHEICTT